MAPTSDRPAAAFDASWLLTQEKYQKPRAAELSRIEAVTQGGPFSADWRGLRAYRTPGWYGAAKFGIFVHWGVFSVPAFNSEWYPRRMYQQGTVEYRHHLHVYGPPDRFGYKAFIPLFQAKNFHPDDWITLFRAAGARYVVPVAEHHDGFALYDSHLSDWTSVKMGPHRDIIGELATAARRAGLRFGLSSHLAEHDWFFDEGRRIASDVNDPATAALYGPAQPRMMTSDEDIDVGADYTHVSEAWTQEWLARSAELVDLYHPDLIYFDWWIAKGEFRSEVPRFLAYYYDTMSQRHPDETGVVNYKSGAMLPGTGVLDIERGVADRIQPEPWQTCTSISRKAWGYIEGDDYKSAPELLRVLVDVVSKNGNLLLNVGPRADGTIPAPAVATLQEMGAWLHRNGEAIYDTHPWREFAEGPTRATAGTFGEKRDLRFTAGDFRFTARGTTVFAIAMGRPAANITLTSFRPDDAIRQVRVLGGGTVPFRHDRNGLHLHLPGDLTDLPVLAIEG